MTSLIAHSLLCSLNILLQVMQAGWPQGAGLVSVSGRGGADGGVGIRGRGLVMGTQGTAKGWHGSQGHRIVLESESHLVV